MEVSKIAKSFWEKYLKPSFEKKLEEKAQQAKQVEPKKKPKKVKGDIRIVGIGIILGQKTPAPVEKPVEEKPETIDVKPVEQVKKPAEPETPVEKPAETAKPAENPEKPAKQEKQETPIHTEPAKQETAESGKPAEPVKPVVPPVIIKEGQQRKLSKAEKKALRKKQKRDEAEKKASSPTTSETTTATDKVKEAVAEGIENGEIDVVHKNPYIELIQSKVKSWDSQGNALDENGNVVVDSNGNPVKVDPVAGVILMAMPKTA